MFPLGGNASLGMVRFDACGEFAVRTDNVVPDFRTYVLETRSGARIASAYVGNHRALGSCETRQVVPCDPSVECSACRAGDEARFIIEHSGGRYVYIYDIVDSASAELMRCVSSAKAAQFFGRDKRGRS